MELGVFLYTLRLKGYLAYEYNPFRNYLTDVDLYEVDTIVGKVLVPKGCAANNKTGEILNLKSGKWVDARGNIITDENKIKNVIKWDTGNLYATSGSLIDLDTDKLNFDLEYPVDITIQPSYDGSVNLILNDGKNIPRIINSRFSVREKNTYEIVDRIGENDTNIYNSNTFDKDTSLYFLYEYNPKIQYLGFVNGKLKVGLYCFYFTYCDSDNNESDYIAETGVIPVFIGSDSDLASMDGGIKNQETDKGIRLKLSNLDKSYNYLKVYYVRYFADYQLNRVSECKKLFKRFPINSNILYLQITGNEEAEDLDANILNKVRFNPQSIYTQAQCKNILFFGNIKKNTDNYKELQDCALRISPTIKINNLFEFTNNNYIGSGYYNSENMYNYVGYFNNEYYRFGVVFIYLNGTLSNVYNILGGDVTPENTPIINLDIWTLKGAILTRNYIKSTEEGWIKEEGTGTNLNSKGVCRISGFNENQILGIQFNIPEDVKKFLKEDLGIRGCFFVRQKRVPKLLALCFMMKMDDLLKAPVLCTVDSNNKKNYWTECFAGLRELTINNSYQDHLYWYHHTEDSENALSNSAFAGICPDFLLNQPYFNQIFNNSTFTILKIAKLPLNNIGRIYKGEIEYITKESEKTNYKVRICTVTEEVPTVAIKDKVYKTKIGEIEEAFRFEYAEVDNGVQNIGSDSDSTKVNESANIVRGQYSPYLAIYSDTPLEDNCIYNIYQTPINSNITQEFQNRMDSSEPFYAISDRYNFNEFETSLTCYKGDCYFNIFTYRLNRNFNDPSLPNNDVIIDPNTWKTYYDISKPEEWGDISRSDINAVQLGSWITLPIKSYVNYALRSEDHSYVSEEALMGAPRSFYPRSNLLARGNNKMPDSYLYNDAYRATLGFKCYYTLLDINYIKNVFSNRIQYSEIAIQDSYKNNYRESYSTYNRDYSQEYGSIQKIMEYGGNLLVVFEHAIGVAVVNERIVASQGDGNPVFINTKNVLPEELTILSNTYGTLWPESVIKTENGYIYGVDTIAKKIWRIRGNQIEILSDMKVNKFLIDNISLGERENSPIIGLKNVKTHYNNNKKDIMFTFYDDVYLDEEKVWNLCFNEILNQFTTFYSWVPSYSENIDTQFFTFNRTTSKLLSLLNKCNYGIIENTGVLLEPPFLVEGETQLHYVIPEKHPTYTVQNLDGTTEIKDVSTRSHYNNYEVANVQFVLEKDHWGNYKYFECDENGVLPNNKLKLRKETIYTPSKNAKIQENIIEFSEENVKITGENIELLKGEFLEIPEELIKAQKGVLLLNITPKIITTNPSQEIIGVETGLYFKSQVVAITTKEWLKDNLTEDFYLHGRAGIFDVEGTLIPTFWYDEYHPFEFEFIVNDKIGQQKLFTNLVLISNKAEPESFHFEIEGDNYEFSSDKRTMYFRQEATKELYLQNGSDIIYDRNYHDVTADKYTLELYYRGGNNYNYDTIHTDKVYPQSSKGLVQLKKSTIFPQYYERIDTYNDIYHLYHQMKGNSEYDLSNLSGSEIKWDRDANQFNIVTHIKNKPINLFGRLRGNSFYKDGTWNLQIPSITYELKNEKEWTDNIPPIVINSQYVPKDLEGKYLDISNIYTGYLNTIDKDDTTPVNYGSYVDINKDWTHRKEAKIRDKWMKVRVRYSGKNLAVIHSIITLYNV